MNKFDVIYEMIKGSLNQKKDLIANDPHEEWVKEYIVAEGLAKTAERVDNKDIKIRKTRDLTTTDPKHIIEIKRDAACYKWGNIYFEFISHGNPSGYLTTKADWWFQSFYCNDGIFRTGIAKIEDVRYLLNNGNYPTTLKGGGDRIGGKGASDGFKVPWKHYYDICFHKNELDIVEYIKLIGLYDEFARRSTQKQNPAW